MKQTFAHHLAALLALAALVAAGPATARGTNAPSSGTATSPSAETGLRHAAAAPSAQAGLLDLSAFRLISERNIFNPNRSSHGDDRTTRREPERRVRTESFALLGTMSYEKGRFAFFDGSNADYRKVLQATNQIAGFKITTVAPTCVKLQDTNGQSIELCVGMHMSKLDEGDWHLYEHANGDSASSASSAGTNDSPESNDLIKRMMERRQSEGAPEPAAPAEPAPAAAQKTETNSSSASEPDEVIRRLLQKREQELNK